jgi:hypothetical protein
MGSMHQVLTAPGRAPCATPPSVGILQRCACGGISSANGKCDECRRKRLSGVQPRLIINRPGDRYEQEADRVAEHVMRADADPSAQSIPQAIPRVTPIGITALQREAVTDEDEDEGNLAIQTARRAPCEPRGAALVGTQLAELRDGGHPLDGAAREFFEQRFGHDFSRIRIHSDARAGQLAHALAAQAFTIGNHVVFGSGQYEPMTHAGRSLLAHELTHVLQQRPVANAFSAAARRASSAAGGKLLVQRKTETPYKAEILSLKQVMESKKRRALLAPTGATEAKLCKSSRKETTKENCPVVLKPRTPVTVKEVYAGGGWVFVECPPIPELDDQTVGYVLGAFVKPESKPGKRKKPERKRKPKPEQEPEPADVVEPEAEEAEDPESCVRFVLVRGKKHVRVGGMLQAIPVAHPVYKLQLEGDAFWIAVDAEDLIAYLSKYTAKWVSGPFRFRWIDCKPVFESVTAEELKQEEGPAVSGPRYTTTPTYRVRFYDGKEISATATELSFAMMDPTFGDKVETVYLIEQFEKVDDPKQIKKGDRLHFPYGIISPVEHPAGGQSGKGDSAGDVAQSPRPVSVRDLPEKGKRQKTTGTTPGGERQTSGWTGIEGQNRATRHYFGQLGYTFPNWTRFPQGEPESGMHYASHIEMILVRWAGGATITVNEEVCAQCIGGLRAHARGTGQAQVVIDPLFRHEFRSDGTYVLIPLTVRGLERVRNRLKRLERDLRLGRPVTVVRRRAVPTRVEVPRLLQNLRTGQRARRRGR